MLKSSMRTRRAVPGALLTGEFAVGVSEPDAGFGVAGDAVCAMDCDAAMRKQEMSRRVRLKEFLRVSDQD